MAKRSGETTGGEGNLPEKIQTATDQHLESLENLWERVKKLRQQSVMHEQEFATIELSIDALMNQLLTVKRKREGAAEEAELRALKRELKEISSKKSLLVERIGNIEAQLTGERRAKKKEAKAALKAEEDQLLQPFEQRKRKLKEKLETKRAGERKDDPKEVYTKLLRALIDALEPTRFDKQIYITLATANRAKALDLFDELKKTLPEKADGVFTKIDQLIGTLKLMGINRKDLEAQAAAMTLDAATAGIEKPPAIPRFGDKKNPDGSPKPPREQVDEFVKELRGKRKDIERVLSRKGLSNDLALKGVLEEIKDETDLLGNMYYYKGDKWNWRPKDKGETDSERIAFDRYKATRPKKEYTVRDFNEQLKLCYELIERFKQRLITEKKADPNDFEPRVKIKHERLALEDEVTQIHAGESDKAARFFNAFIRYVKDVDAEGRIWQDVFYRGKLEKLRGLTRVRSAEEANEFNAAFKEVLEFMNNEMQELGLGKISFRAIETATTKVKAPAIDRQPGRLRAEKLPVPDFVEAKNDEDVNLYFDALYKLLGEKMLGSLQYQTRKEGKLEYVESKEDSAYASSAELEVNRAMKVLIDLMRGRAPDAAKGDRGSRSIFSRENTKEVKKTKLNQFNTYFRAVLELLNAELQRQGANPLTFAELQSYITQEKNKGEQFWNEKHSQDWESIIVYKQALNAIERARTEGIINEHPVAADAKPLEIIAAGTYWKARFDGKNEDEAVALAQAAKEKYEKIVDENRLKSITESRPERRPRNFRERVEFIRKRYARDGMEDVKYGTISDIIFMAEGGGEPDIREAYYIGWTDDDFKTLLEEALQMPFEEIVAMREDAFAAEKEEEEEREPAEETQAELAEQMGDEIGFITRLFIRAKDLRATLGLPPLATEANVDAMIDALRDTLDELGETEGVREKIRLFGDFKIEAYRAVDLILRMTQGLEGVGRVASRPPSEPTRPTEPAAQPAAPAGAPSRPAEPTAPSIEPAAPSAAPPAAPPEKKGVWGWIKEKARGFKNAVFNKEAGKALLRGGYETVTSVLGIKLVTDAVSAVFGKGDLAEYFRERKESQNIRAIIAEATENLGIAYEKQKRGEALTETEGIEQRAAELREKISTSKKLTEAEKGTLFNTLQSILNEHADATEQTRQMRDDRIQRVLESYVAQKISGIKIARDAMNFALTAAGLPVLRAVAYAGASLLERARKASKAYTKQTAGKIEKGKQEAFVAKDVFVNATIETVRALTGRGVEAGRTGKERAVDWMRAFGTITRGFGIYGVAVSGLEAPQQGVDRFLDQIEKQGLGTTVAENFATNAQRAIYVYTHPGKILKRLFGGADSTASQSEQPQITAGEIQLADFAAEHRLSANSMRALESLVREHSSLANEKSLERIVAASAVGGGVHDEFGVVKGTINTLEEGGGIRRLTIFDELAKKDAGDAAQFLNDQHFSKRHLSYLPEKYRGNFKGLVDEYRAASGAKKDVLEKALFRAFQGRETTDLANAGLEGTVNGKHLDVRVRGNITYFGVDANADKPIFTGEGKVRIVQIEDRVAKDIQPESDKGFQIEEHRTLQRSKNLMPEVSEQAAPEAGQEAGKLATDAAKADVAAAIQPEVVSRRISVLKEFQPEPSLKSMPTAGHTVAEAEKPSLQPKALEDVEILSDEVFKDLRPEWNAVFNSDWYEGDDAHIAEGLQQKLERAIANNSDLRKELHVLLNKPLEESEGTLMQIERLDRLGNIVEKAKLAEGLTPEEKLLFGDYFARNEKEFIRNAELTFTAEDGQEKRLPAIIARRGSNAVLIPRSDGSFGYISNEEYIWHAP